MDAGDWQLALRIAARFPRLGEHGPAIKLGHEAYVHPDFYRQLGKAPHLLIEKGKRALIARYGRAPKLSNS